MAIGRPQSRTAVLERLRAHEQELRSAGAAALFLFGSIARDEAREDSDVDLFLDVDQHRSFTMFDLAGLQRRTVQILGRDVDIMTREGISLRRRPAIEAQAVRVY